MATLHAVQDRKTGKLFAGLYGVRDVEWTFDKNMAYQMTKGQAQKVVDKLVREKQPCEPRIIGVL